MRYDLIIRGGTIVDGSGRSPFLGDLAIRGGVIAAIGNVVGAAAEEIDATDCIVTPGFVDVHTHYDGQITWENRLVPSSDHGVTTVVMGNCGVGFAPVRPGDEGLMIRLMEGVEDIPEVVMATGVPFDWSSFPEYLDAIEARESDVDFAAQIPHSPLRVFVMGQRGADLEPATGDDLTEMTRLTREAVEAGALGVSTSRYLFHRFRSGAHVPSARSSIDELQALGAGLREAGAGVFQCIPSIDSDPAEEVAVMTAVARASRRPVNFSLIHNPAQPHGWETYLRSISSARDEGFELNGQFSARPTGVLLGLDLTFHPFALNPSYRPLADLPLEDKVCRLRDPELRARLIAEEIDDPNPMFRMLLERLTTIFRLDDPADYDFHPEDSLQARAAREGRDSREVIYDALLEDEGRAVLCAFGNDVQDYLERTAPLIGSDNLIVALGDGGAHYGMICDAAYTTYMLTGRVGRDGLDLATTIRALTSQPAGSVGLCDRGVLAAGYKADVNVIDLDHLTLRRPHVRRDLPAGGRRLAQGAKGYVATLVSGVVTHRDDRSTGALPGRLVRGQRPAPKPVPA